MKKTLGFTLICSPIFFILFLGYYSFGFFEGVIIPFSGIIFFLFTIIIGMNLLADE